VSYRSPLVLLDFSRGSELNRILRDQLVARMHQALPALGQIVSPRNCLPPVCATSYQISGLNRATRLRGLNELSFRLSVMHAFNLDWCPTMCTVLKRHKREYQYHIPPGLHSFINTWLTFMIANIANRDQVSTYSLQVTRNHPTSTGLSMLSICFDPGPNRDMTISWWTRKYIYAAMVSPNSYNLMHQI
jgi:hypothetical protein